MRYPVLIDVDDYHDFAHIESIIQKLSDKKIKVQEINLDEFPAEVVEFLPPYIGVVFVGRKLSKSKIKKLLLGGYNKIIRIR